METLEVEAVYAMAFDTFRDFADCLPRFIDHIDNGRPPHSSLGYFSPMQVGDQLPRQTQRPILHPKELQASLDINGVDTS